MAQGARLKGLVLSGGTGSRLRPFTYSTAKQLLPLANKPVLFYVIEAMVEAGITDIGVVVGSTAEQITAALGDGSRFGAELSYVPQDAPRGLAHAVQTARPFLGDDPFAVFLGDNLLRGGIAGTVEAFAAGTSDAQLLVKPVPNPSEFGIAELHGDGSVRRLIEKPAAPASNLAILGVYMLRRRFFEAAQTIRPSARGELEITDALQAMIDGGMEVCARVVEEDWIDTGSPLDLLAANRMLLCDPRTYEGYVRLEGTPDDAPVQIAADVRLSGTQLTGPAIIGRATEITDSRIGPGTSIGAGCRIRGATIDESIVMDGAVVEGARLRNSIIGRGAVVRGGGDGAFEGLLLGDEGRVELV
ncbi:MAG TPA: glucose-1-phosphate thymidylyltransferase [Dehalococcoidia bacterium]|nr:glucose-1-phosphate thymidylyltransferase [Dehalococcoidia bacterium]